jgi:periplasmic divalent cation tolerance protein
MADAVALVLTTAPDAAVAERIVQTLVEERLVACGNIVPGVVSIYRWEGQVERAGEVLVVLKTTPARTDAVLARVPALHPYDVPEALVVPVHGGHPPYVRWVVSSCGERSED